MKFIQLIGRYAAQQSKKVSSHHFRSLPLNSFSTTTTSSDKTFVPDEFFDDAIEADKEFCDFSMTLLKHKGLEEINSLSEKYSWDDLSKYATSPVLDNSNSQDNDPDFLEFVSQIKSYKAAISTNNAAEISQEREKLKQQMKSKLSVKPPSPNDNINADVARPENEAEPLEHKLREQVAMETMNFDPTSLPNLAESTFFTNHELNSSMGYGLKPEERIPPTLRPFVPNTDPTKFASDQQGLRHCPGGRQRRGREPDAPLRCHILDLDRLNPIDISGLKRFLSRDAEILPKKLTGLCSRCQRQVARTVKTSRSMGILPHLGYVHLTDLQPSRHNQSFHKVVTNGGKRDKPILSKLVPIR